jgi:hypothetical protein
MLKRKHNQSDPIVRKTKTNPKSATLIPIPIPMTLTTTTILHSNSFKRKRYIDLLKKISSPYLGHVSLKQRLHADNALFDAMQPVVSSWVSKHYQLQKTITDYEDRHSISKYHADRVVVMSNLCVCGYNVGCTLDLEALSKQIGEYGTMVDRIKYFYVVRPPEPKRCGRWTELENGFPFQQSEYPMCINFIYSSGHIISMGSPNEFFAKLSLMKQVRDLVALGYPVILNPKRITIMHSQLTCKVPFLMSEHVDELCKHFNNKAVYIAPKSIRSVFTVQAIDIPVRIHITTTGCINVFDCPSIVAGLQVFEQVYRLLFLYRNGAPSEPVFQLLKSVYGLQKAQSQFQKGWLLDQLNTRKNAKKRRCILQQKIKKEQAKETETYTTDSVNGDESDDGAIDNDIGRDSPDHMEPLHELQELIYMSTA